MRRITLVFMMAAALMLALPSAAYASGIYVSTGGSDTTGAGTVDSPYATIQHAIDVANPGAVVVVVPGEYIENITMKDGVSLWGARARDTTIKAKNPGPVVTIQDLGDGEGFSGFTICGGYGLTGGIYCESSSPTIERCTIRDNTSEGMGGGIYCVSSSPKITNCTIRDNIAYDGGGGIYCASSSPKITNCSISGNIAYYSSGGGIYCASSSPKITNCTVADNIADSYGGGIYSDSSSPTIKNCIVWGNGDDLWGCAATYSCISSSEDAAGVHNISVDPRFVDAANGDYHIQSGSPCINTASPVGAPTIDTDNVPRPQGAGYDMGAYEYWTVDPTLSSKTHAVRVASSATHVTIDITPATGISPAAAGYAILVSQDATAYPATTVTHDASTASFSFDAASAGVWYVNVATLDAAGRWSEGVSFGPILIIPSVTTTQASGGIKTVPGAQISTQVSTEAAAATVTPAAEAEPAEKIGTPSSVDGADVQAAPVDEQDENRSLGWVPPAVVGLIALIGGIGAWQVLARPRP